MASSRRSAGSVSQALAEAVGGQSEAARTAAFGSEGAPGRGHWVVAFSGGLDSTVLLHATVQAAGPKNVTAVHVHHGLQSAADIWPAHCEARAREFGARYECVTLKGPPPRGASVEEWARDERYRALSRVARRLRASAVLTAHHADDQVETVLMRIARGTGIDGMAGIEPAVKLAGALVLRPLLALERARLVEHAQRHRLRWIEDPSNADLRRTRNAIRHRVLPAIDAAAPRFRAHLLESLPQLRAARDAQAALAAEDLDRARSAGVLDRRVLAELPAARRHAALRAWLREQRLRMPSQARLLEMDRQLVSARGAHGRVLHEGIALVRHRDAIRACDARLIAPAPTPTIELNWRAERSVELPQGGGRLLFEDAEPDAPGSVSASWLGAQPLTVTAGGASGARLRPRPGARSRTLKNLYQERAVPAWMRAGLPLVYSRGSLLYASGVGMDCDETRPSDGRCVTLRWEPSRGDDPRAAWCSGRDD